MGGVGERIVLAVAWSTRCVAARRIGAVIAEYKIPIVSAASTMVSGGIWRYLWPIHTATRCSKTEHIVLYVVRCHPADTGLIEGQEIRVQDSHNRKELQYQANYLEVSFVLIGQGSGEREGKQGHGVVVVVTGDRGKITPHRSIDGARWRCLCQPRGKIQGAENNS